MHRSANHSADKTKGILLAIAATVIWSGNFVVARGIAKDIGPVSLAFYRWLTASLLLAPIAWNQFRSEYAEIKKYRAYLFWVAITGVTIFNTCVYVAGHYTTAINMALIGTTSSPIFATVLAAVFLKERPGFIRITGMLLCIAGILLLISKGSWEILRAFHFSLGDVWVLAGAFAFAVYSTLVRKKPAGISSLSFLLAVFSAGTVLLVPFFVIETAAGNAVNWSASIGWVILYLGAGASVTAFLCWNVSIQKIGAGRTVLFGNLIPVFSVLEAVWLLGEKISIIHLISGLLVIGGLILANLKLSSPKKQSS